MDSPKYERTFHFPWSPGGTSDDKRMLDVSGLLKTEVVFTEKMDGSNVCMEAEACFARTHSGPPDHPSFSAFKQLHATVKSKIPNYLQVFGEWCWALHSIPYSALPTYFLMFGVRDLRTMTWGSWEEVTMWAEELGVSTVPELRRAVLDTEEELRYSCEELAALPSLCGGQREGLVVRVTREFSNEDFPKLIGKMVRANHVQTSGHWRNQEIVKNKLV